MNGWAIFIGKDSDLDGKHPPNSQGNLLETNLSPTQSRNNETAKACKRPQLRLCPNGTYQSWTEWASANLEVRPIRIFMTHELLVQRITSFRKFSRAVTGIMLVLVLYPPWLLVLSSHFGWTAPDDSRAILAMLVCVFGSFTLGCILCFWRLKRCALLCPHCRRSLVNRYPVVITTDTCSHCGKCVIDASA